MKDFADFASLFAESAREVCPGSPLFSEDAARERPRFVAALLERDPKERQRKWDAAVAFRRRELEDWKKLSDRLKDKVDEPS